MRFLHTADWHVGKTLRGRSRMDEYAAALEELTRIAVDSKVDAVLVAGDVFDSAAPAPEAEGLVYDFLARLLPERIACLIIGGNHDHPRKLGALAGLLEGLRFHVRPEVRPPDQGGVVSITSRDGSEQARVAVVPFVPERKIVRACQLLEPERDWYEEYALRVAQILRLLTKGLSPDTVNVVLGHLLLSGARVGSGERPLHLSGAYGVDAQQMPPGLQYIGLGHLHRPQEVVAPSRTLYSGSLIELDFGEKEQDKRAVLVEAQAGEPARVESIALTAGRRLREIEATLDQIEGLAAEAGSDFLRIGLRVAGPSPGLAEQVKQNLPGALEVRLLYERDDQVSSPLVCSSLAPLELFREFYLRKNGADPDPEISRLFEAVHEEATAR